MMEEKLNKVDNSKFEKQHQEVCSLIEEKEKELDKISKDTFVYNKHIKELTSDLALLYTKKKELEELIK